MQVYKIKYYFENLLIKRKLKDIGTIHMKV